jgi:hypothetical protein
MEGLLEKTDRGQLLDEFADDLVAAQTTSHTTARTLVDRRPQKVRQLGGNAGRKAETLFAEVGKAPHNATLPSDRHLLIPPARRGLKPPGLVKNRRYQGIERAASLRKSIYLSGGANRVSKRHGTYS